MRTVPILVAVVGLLALPVLAGCGSRAGSAVSGGVVEVVAAENFWGSIAAQLGGSHAHVASVISNPDTDPHAYEPTPQDARAVARAQYVVINGAGYDPWAQKLLDADPESGRITLSVADLAGRREGDNPHMWYSPGVVMSVIARIAADLARLDPNDAPYFRRQMQSFTGTALAGYDRLRSEIRTTFAGTPVGATESVVVDLAADLRLRLVTPAGYMTAIAEGDDPTPQDKATVDAQVGGRQIAVLIFNRQNATPDIQALVDRARSEGIPVVAITETLDPATATFQGWQAGQLQALADALSRAAR
jgi:zinc/manganese transport system substrate-binding protein